MSMVCIGYVYAPKSSAEQYPRELIDIAKTHNRGIRFDIDWEEPFLHNLDKDMLCFSLSDSQSNDNADVLFLPDGWYINGETNDTPFVERMKFLCDVAKASLYAYERMGFFIGTSGTLYNEFYQSTVSLDNLLSLLTNSIGMLGDEIALHVQVQM